MITSTQLSRCCWVRKTNKLKIKTRWAVRKLVSDCSDVNWKASWDLWKYSIFFAQLWLSDVGCIWNTKLFKELKHIESLHWTASDHRRVQHSGEPALLLQYHKSLLFGLNWTAKQHQPRRYGGSHGCNCGWSYFGGGESRRPQRGVDQAVKLGRG